MSWLSAVTHWFLSRHRRDRRLAQIQDPDSLAVARDPAISETAEAATSSPASPPFPLMSLPTELRTMVHRHLIAMGAPEIICASSQMRQEAALYIPIDGCLRIRIVGNGQRLEPIQILPTHLPDLPTTIPRVELKFDLADMAAGHPYNQELAPLGRFLSTIEEKKVCIVVINHNMASLACEPPFTDPNTVFRLIRGLTLWENVRVCAVADGKMNARFDDWSPREKNEAMYELITRNLEGTLGPSIWHESESANDRYVAFRPSEYRKSLE